MLIRNEWESHDGHRRAPFGVNDLLDGLREVGVVLREATNLRARSLQVECHLQRSARDQRAVGPGENRSESQPFAPNEAVSVESFRAAVADDQGFETTLRKRGARVGHDEPIFHKVDQQPCVAAAAPGVIAVLQQLKELSAAVPLDNGPFAVEVAYQFPALAAVGLGLMLSEGFDDAACRGSGLRQAVIVGGGHDSVSRQLLLKSFSLFLKFLRVGLLEALQVGRCHWSRETLWST